VKTVLWQETATWQEGSDSVAGNGDVPPAPVSRARRSAFPAEPGLLNAPNYVPSRPARTPQTDGFLHGTEDPVQIPPRSSLLFLLKNALLL